MILVIAKSDLDDVISLPVTIVTEMRYPGVDIEKNSVNISVAMDFYAVFRTDTVINHGKTFLGGSKSPKIMVLTYFGFLTFFEFFCYIPWIFKSFCGNIICFQEENYYFL